MSFRALAEKSPTIEKETIVHEDLKHSPAVDHRREIPRGRNGTLRTRASGGSAPRPQGLRALPAETHRFKAFPLGGRDAAVRSTVKTVLA